MAQVNLLNLKQILMKNIEIYGITPFEKPDVKLALALERAKAFPILHLGYDRNEAAAALEEMAAGSSQPFGVCLGGPLWEGFQLPERVSLVVLPFLGATKDGEGTPGDRVGAGDGAEAMRDHAGVGDDAETRGTGDGRRQEKSGEVGQARVLYQIYSVEEARRLKQLGVRSFIIKGNEGAGRVGEASSFILFQRIRMEMPEIAVYVQGGVGVHNAAALSALGAAGVVLDSQLVLFDECRAPAAVKKLCEHLNGSETRVVHQRRVLVRPHAQEERAGETDELPLGQDIVLSADLVQRYKKLDRLVFGLREAMYGHLKQAKVNQAISVGNGLAAGLHIEFPIAQGPMTRVSDVPAFAKAVAEGGGLPFVALSLLKGEQARQLIRETRIQAGGRTWGVGILGFVDQALREEQLGYILEEKPPVVLIAGGRPSQAKPLEKAGIKTFLHVPSVTLLDMFLKEGAKRFVFEGRECGGHVGPLGSLVLWEKQVVRLLQDEHPEELELFFAGGIHDAASAAFVAVMAAPLVARGARVGVLMGTAYLYTEEAVTTGAIVPAFQAQAIAQQDTLLLETAPGHETRCLSSNFAIDFNKEKTRLLRQGLDKQAIWAQLEKLNVGRLRIAAKGIERQGEQLVKIDEREQLASGMYMIGQVVALKNKVVTIRELHADVTEGNGRLILAAGLPELPESSAKALNVAVIGMACIYPGAKNIEEYWRNVLLGKDCITEVPDERWNKELYYDAQSMNGDKSPSKWGGFIPRIEFDPMEFGIPPQSLAAIEPSQLLALLVAKQALEHAGYAGPEVNKENVSVIIGAEGGNDLSNNYGFRCLFRQLFGEMPPEVDAALPKLTEDSFPGVLANVIAGRITNRLDLGGRNYTVDAACASSLAAIDLACQELILEKSDMVIAGAVDLHNGINDYLLFSSTHALSRNGRCMTFDSAADGIALGEGVAMLVLKRHEDALRDGDTVYAVIRGVGGSSDGRSLGLTAPRRAGQEKALERAYQQAGLSPIKVGLIEAHGTGTVVGDKTELSALTELMTISGAVPGQTHLGSVKTQIGHTKCAAGMAGFIKAVLSVYHGVKPPTLHLQQPNSYYRHGKSPFAFNTEAGLWSEAHRVAGVSAFGFGGTNFHAVLENAAQSKENGPTLEAWPTELFVFRGDTYDEAMQLLKSVRTILLNSHTMNCRDLAYSLAVDSDKKVQLSIVADCTDDLLLKMDLALSGAGAGGLFPLKPVDGKTAFLFPGQGSQHINMARGLFVLFPVMRKLLREHPELEKVVFPEAVFDESALKEQRNSIRDTRLAQPLLGIVDYAIASLLREWGIEPDMVAGHSYGELPALCFAGAFEERELVILSEKRSRAILDSIAEDKGTMVAVQASEDLLRRLAPEESGVYLVNHNSPKQWVLAGGTAQVAAVVEKFKEEKISYKQLEVACAFHSPLLAGSKDLYFASIQETEFRAPQVPVWSNTTAREYPIEATGIRERLADHLIKPVEFTAEIENMYAAGARLFIEVGPGRTLTGLTRDILNRDELTFYTEDKQGVTHLLSLVGAYLATGRGVRLEKLFEGRTVRKLDLRNAASFKRSNTVWIVNGQMAVPAVGQLPPHGALPVMHPLKLSQAGFGALPPAAAGAERMVEEYLKNMQQLIQAQRDVMLGYLGQTPAPLPAPRTIPVTAKPVEAIVAGGEEKAVVTAVIGEETIKVLLLKVVSDKTGYPPDMLDLKLDMEADLSIDSIKRMEIIATLRTKMGDMKTGEEDLTERLTSVKTLQGLIDLIVGSAGEPEEQSELSGEKNVTGENGEPITGPVEEAKKIIEEGFVHHGEALLVRKRFELAPATFSPAVGRGAGLLKGKRIAITGIQSSEIRNVLEESGVLTDTVVSGGADGLIVTGQPDILELVRLVKQLDPTRVKWVYVLSDNSREYPGYAGFLKSLDKEWEHTVCRAIHFETTIAAGVLAAIVREELFITASQPEIFYVDGVRMIKQEVAEDLAGAGEAGVQLDKESVVLVLGGAQGITSELIQRLSRDYPCRYILAGRSADPRAGADQGYTSLKTKAAIREAIIGKGEIRSPAEIERKSEELYKRNQVLHTLEILEANGARADYHSVDCKDVSALSKLVRGIYLEYGRIDGVVHGAGLLEDKLFRQKTIESFERVFATKVNPLRVLEAELRPDVQFIVLFSSVASVYGNRGQTDYAAANSVLDWYASALREKIEGKVLAINWGPWKGAGMVAAELEREYERRGIALIPLAAGSESFLSELKYGKDNQVLIMAGQRF